MSVPRGVLAAVLTPLDASLRPNANVAVPYYASLLERGCDGLNVLGTTGEAMSIGLRERLAFMEAVADALPRERLMVGTGASALEDAVELTRAAITLGFAAALVIPPFYYRDGDDDGVLAFYDALFARTQPPPESIALYNFPRMSGVTFHPALVDRLMQQFGSIICALKDSSSDRELEVGLAHEHPELAIYPASETLLGFARENGLAGCISGSVCLWPELAHRAWADGERVALLDLASNRNELGVPLIARVRERVAAEQNSRDWLRTLPPLGAITTA